MWGMENTLQHDVEGSAIRHSASRPYGDDPDLTTERMNARLERFLQETDMGTRIRRVLERHFDQDALVSDLVRASENELLCLQHFGSCSMLILQRTLQQNGLAPIPSSAPLFVRWDGQHTPLKDGVQ